VGKARGGRQKYQSAGNNTPLPFVSFVSAQWRALVKYQWRPKMKVIALTLALIAGGLATASNASAVILMGKVYTIELIGSDIILSEPSPDFLPPIPLHKPPIPRH